MSFCGTVTEIRILVMKVDEAVHSGIQTFVTVLSITALGDDRVFFMGI